MPTPLFPTGVRMNDSADVLAQTRASLPRTINVTAGTLSAGDITGSTFVTLISSNAAPGTQTTRTSAQMYADDPTSSPIRSYMLRVCNSGAGTFTLAGGSGVTVTGTATVATATFRDFNVTYSGTYDAPLMTVTNIGLGTYT